MEDKLISAKDLLAAVSARSSFDTYDEVVLETIVAALPDKNTSSKGHWCAVDQNGDITFRCSVCNAHFPRRAKFCIECGANMQ